MPVSSGGRSSSMENIAQSGGQEKSSDKTERNQSNSKEEAERPHKDSSATDQLEEESFLEGKEEILSETRGTGQMDSACATIEDTTEAAHPAEDSSATDQLEEESFYEGKEEILSETTGTGQMDSACATIEDTAEAAHPAEDSSATEQLEEESFLEGKEEILSETTGTRKMDSACASIEDKANEHGSLDDTTEAARPAEDSSAIIQEEDENFLGEEEDTRPEATECEEMDFVEKRNNPSNPLSMIEQPDRNRPQTPEDQKISQEVNGLTNPTQQSQEDTADSGIQTNSIAFETKLKIAKGIVPTENKMNKEKPVYKLSSEPDMERKQGFQAKLRFAQETSQMQTCSTSILNKPQNAETQSSFRQISSELDAERRRSFQAKLRFAQETSKIIDTDSTVEQPKGHSEKKLGPVKFPEAKAIKSHERGKDTDANSEKGMERSPVKALNLQPAGPDTQAWMSFKDKLKFAEESSQGLTISTTTNDKDEHQISPADFEAKLRHEVYFKNCLSIAKGKRPAWNEEIEHGRGMIIPVGSISGSKTFQEDMVQTRENVNSSTKKEIQKKATSVECETTRDTNKQQVFTKNQLEEELVLERHSKATPSNIQAKNVADSITTENKASQLASDKASTTKPGTESMPSFQDKLKFAEATSQGLTIAKGNMDTYVTQKQSRSPEEKLKHKSYFKGCLKIAQGHEKAWDTEQIAPPQDRYKNISSGNRRIRKLAFLENFRGSENIESEGNEDTMKPTTPGVKIECKGLGSALARYESEEDLSSLECTKHSPPSLRPDIIDTNVPIKSDQTVCKIKHTASNADIKNVQAEKNMMMFSQTSSPDQTFTITNQDSNKSKILPEANTTKTRMRAAGDQEMPSQSFVNVQHKIYFKECLNIAKGKTLAWNKDSTSPKTINLSNNEEQRKLSFKEKLAWAKKKEGSQKKDKISNETGTPDINKATEDSLKRILVEKCSREANHDLPTWEKEKVHSPIRRKVHTVHTTIKCSDIEHTPNTDKVMPGQYAGDSTAAGDIRPEEMETEKKFRSVDGAEIALGCQESTFINIKSEDAISEEVDQDLTICKAAKEKADERTDPEAISENPKTEPYEDTANKSTRKANNLDEKELFTEKTCTYKDIPLKEKPEDAFLGFLPTGNNDVPNIIRYHQHGKQKDKESVRIGSDTEIIPSENEAGKLDGDETRLVIYKKPNTPYIGLSNLKENSLQVDANVFKTDSKKTNPDGVSLETSDSGGAETNRSSQAPQIAAFQPVQKRKLPHADSSYRMRIRKPTSSKKAARIKINSNVTKSTKFILADTVSKRNKNLKKKQLTKSCSEILDTQIDIQSSWNKAKPVSALYQAVRETEDCLQKGGFTESVLDNSGKQIVIIPYKTDTKQSGQVDTGPKEDVSTQSIEPFLRGPGMDRDKPIKEVNGADGKSICMDRPKGNNLHLNEPYELDGGKSFGAGPGTQYVDILSKIETTTSPQAEKDTDMNKTRKKQVSQSGPKQADTKIAKKTNQKEATNSSLDQADSVADKSETTKNVRPVINGQVQQTVSISAGSEDSQPAIGDQFQQPDKAKTIFSDPEKIGTLKDKPPESSKLIQQKPHTKAENKAGKGWPSKSEQSTGKEKPQTDQDAFNDISSPSKSYAGICKGKLSKSVPDTGKDHLQKQGLSESGPSLCKKKLVKSDPAVKSTQVNSKPFKKKVSKLDIHQLRKLLQAKFKDETGLQICHWLRKIGDGTLAHERPSDANTTSPLGHNEAYESLVTTEVEKSSSSQSRIETNPAVSFLHNTTVDDTQLWFSGRTVMKDLLFLCSGVLLLVLIYLFFLHDGMQQVQKFVTMAMSEEPVVEPEPEINLFWKAINILLPPPQN